MKQKVIFWLLAFLIMGIALPINAQQCGDVNASGNVDIGDMVQLISYVLGNQPTPVALAEGDIDNRVNVTMADMIRLAEGFFVYGDFDQLSCTPNDSYSFASSADDTLFIPRFLNIPADQEFVTLPFFTNLKNDSKGIVFYLKYVDRGTGVTFHTSDLAASRDGHDGYATYVADTFMVSIFNLHQGNDVSGLRQAGYVTFQRNDPGIGDIEFSLVDRNTTLRSGVIKDDYDIVIPTVVTVDFTDNILQAAPTELQFESVFDFPPPAVVHNIELSDVSASINWGATVDQDWLQIDLDFGTTPSTIQVSVDPTGLSTGIYNGTVTISNLDFQFDAPVEVPVTLTVVAPFPSMDANCDGRFNISDLTYIVAYLFGNPHGPAPCDPCTGTFPEQ